jgi:hypothetical protein
VPFGTHCSSVESMLTEVASDAQTTHPTPSARAPPAARRQRACRPVSALRRAAQTGQPLGMITERDNARSGGEAFRQLRIDILLRKSFLEQSPFDEVSMGIAHELSHLVLDSIKHPLRRCEKAVDLTAMMLGFRCLFATGTCKEIHLKDHIEVRQQGYLSPEEVRRADRII